jgi:hypothetical protein
LHFNVCFLIKIDSDAQLHSFCQLIDAELRRTVPLDIAEGVASFANEFLAETAPQAAAAALVAGPASGGYSVAAGQIASRLLTLSAAPVDATSIAFNGATALSDGSLSSLVNLLVAAVGNQDLLPPDLCSVGMALLHKVVKGIHPGQTAATGGSEKMPQWIVEGLPRLVVRCVKAQGANDNMVGEGLNLGIALLRQVAFDLF